MGYPPASLIVTTPSNTWKVEEGEDYLLAFVTISTDGRTIASARLKSGRSARRIFAIATYSLLESKWTEYEQVEDLRAGVAISPDGSKLAFPVGYPARLRIIDLRTRRVSDSPVIGRYSEIMLSWSPDGRRIVFDMNQSTPEEWVLHRPAVFVLDVETGKITKIADGEAPAWSPSGEWIAYFHNSEDISNEQWINAPPPDRLSIIRPDGTGSKVLVTLPRNRFFAVSPVWSPSSKTILLNEIWHTEKGTVSIHLLDLATLKMTRKFQDVPPVFGWAAAK
jgi:Tol biopolymer transport system component